MAFLTPAQITMAKAWLNDVFVWGGLITPAESLRKTSYYYYYMYGRSDAASSSGKAASQAICNEILERQFVDTDKAFNTLKDYAFVPSLDPSYRKDKFPTKAELLARYVAWFCKENRIFWNDLTLLPEARDLFKKTYLGEALWEAQCFVSQGDPVVKRSHSTRTSSGAILSTVAGSGPKDNYKASGPQSGNARGLIGTAGTKEVLRGYLYCLADNVSKKKVQYAFVRPLEAAGASNSTTNKVFIGDPSAYRSMPIFVEDLADADNLLRGLISAGKIPSDITSLKVMKAIADSNGYYKLKIDNYNGVSEVYVKASKLNEMLEELGTDCEVDTMPEDRKDITLEEKKEEKTYTIEEDLERVENFSAKCRGITTDAAVYEDPTLFETTVSTFGCDL